MRAKTLLTFPPVPFLISFLSHHYRGQSHGLTESPHIAKGAWYKHVFTSNHALGAADSQFLYLFQCTDSQTVLQVLGEHW